MHFAFFKVLNKAKNYVGVRRGCTIDEHNYDGCSKFPKSAIMKCTCSSQDNCNNLTVTGEILRQLLQDPDTSSTRKNKYTHARLTRKNVLVKNKVVVLVGRKNGEF